MKAKIALLKGLAIALGLVGALIGVFSLIGLFEVFQRKLTGGGPIGKANVAYPLLLVVAVSVLRLARRLFRSAKKTSLPEGHK